MLLMMGKEGWSDGGNTWAADLVDSAMFGLGGEGIPRLALANTLASLKGLGDELERVPIAVDFVQQSQYLASRKQALDEAMDRVDKRVAELERKLCRQDAGPRRELLDGLFGYVIPMFVLLLRRAFGMGLLAPDDQSFLREQGAFVPETVFDLAQISTWLRRILEPVMKPRSKKDSENGNAEPNQPAETDEEKQNRDKLWVMFKKWDEHVMQSMKEYNDELDRRQDIFEKEQRDIAIRAHREKTEREELARNAEQYEDWEKSLRELAQRPRPNVVRWQKVAVGLPFAMPVVDGSNDNKPRQSTTSSSTPRMSSAFLSQRPTQSGTVSPAGSTNLLPAPPAGRQQPALLPTRTPPPPPPPPQLEETTWDEDEVVWFLAELSRPNRRPGDLEACAEALDRTLQEVMAEKGRLKRVGKYLSPGRVNGVGRYE
ncbi:hypothetical protein N0V88_005472 [Collariella sp. IMI 366227]|nr:hypothetical protein N0V88_005472 [Collariella sp. IMI 366227]